MLSIKFTKKERSSDQRIEKATIGPTFVEFMWYHEGKNHVLGLPKECIQMLLGSVKKGVQGSISCDMPSIADQHVCVRIKGDCVLLDYAEKRMTKTERLSVKSLLNLNAFLSDK